MPVVANATLDESELPMLTKHTVVRAALLAAATTLALSACSTQSGEELSVTDPWVRSEAGDMTAMFGEITNNSGADLEIASIETDAAEVVEMHEMVDDGSGNTIMQESESGFVIPAGGSLVLEPGGDHFMFIGLNQELLAGETVTVTVHFVDGEPLTIDATVKDFTGGNEPYGDDSEHGSDTEHGDDSDHGDHSDDTDHDEHGDHE